jgi:hypothetical protein
MVSLTFFTGFSSFFQRDSGALAGLVPALVDNYCIELASLIAYTAFGAPLLIDHVRLFFFASGRLSGTLESAGHAAVAFLRIDLVVK